MNLFDIFKSKTDEEKIQYFCDLLNQQKNLTTSYKAIQEDFAKSSMSVEKNVNVTHEIVGLCNENVKIEKSKERLEKRNPHLKDVFDDLKNIDTVRREYENGNISKSILFDVIKAKKGVVEYADVLVMDECGRILVLSRINENGSRDGVGVPGGHVDLGEDFATAARRELFEETFLDVNPENLYNIGSYSDSTAHIEYFAVSMCDIKDKDIILDSSEHSNYEWVKIDELDKQPFIFDMKENLKTLLSRKSSGEKIKIKGGKKKVTAVEVILKGYTQGWISQQLFDEFVKKNKQEIEKANKHYFSEEEREMLAEKNEAMPNGKYPIRNKQDLHDAIRLSGSSNMPTYKVRNWIKKRAKELGLENELPKDWTNENEKGIEKTVTMGEQGEVLSVESLEGKEKKLEKSVEEEKTGFGIELTFKDLEQAEMFKSLTESWKKEGKLNIEEIKITESFQKSIAEKDEKVKQATLTFLNWIEGCKTRLKNLHWTEENNSKHVYIDELLSALDEFEDKFAESIQASVGRFKDGEIQGENVEIDDPLKIIDTLFEYIIDMRDALENNEKYNGEISWMDDFTTTLKQSKYRIEME